MNLVTIFAVLSTSADYRSKSYRHGNCLIYICEEATLTEGRRFRAGTTAGFFGVGSCLVSFNYGRRFSVLPIQAPTWIFLVFAKAFGLRCGV